MTFSSKGKKSNRLTLTIRSNKGTYPGKPQKRQIRFYVISEMKSNPSKVTVNGRQLVGISNPSEFEKDFYLTTPNGVLVFIIDTDAKPVDINIIW